MHLYKATYETQTNKHIKLILTHSTAIGAALTIAERNNITGYISIKKIA